MGQDGSQSLPEILLLPRRLGVKYEALLALDPGGFGRGGLLASPLVRDRPRPAKRGVEQKDLRLVGADRERESERAEDSSEILEQLSNYRKPDGAGLAAEGRTQGRGSTAAREAVIGGSAAGWWKMSAGGSGGAAAEEGPIGIPFPDHSSEILGGLNEQRLSGALCDLLLVAQGCEFPAHRSVLAACSPYFHKLFTSGAAADRQSVYGIDFVSPGALASLLDFAYTATLTLNATNVGEVLSAARLLEIRPVREVCCHLLETKVLSTQGCDAALGRGEEGAEGSSRQTHPPGDSVDQGNWLRAREYLEFFQSCGSHWSSSCSTPELGDPGHRNGGGAGASQSNGSTAPSEHHSPLGMPQHPSLAGEEEEVEVEEGGEGDRKRRGRRKRNEGGDPLAWAASGAFQPSQNGHYSEEYRERLSRGEGGRGCAGGPGVGGEKKMRSKAFQKCPICSKVIQGAGKLPRHIRTHTGEKPY
ncbi:zinc finger and BTB domain-containing protein 7A-like, partial [Acipenser oxyrinchus oxyrinchus]